MNSSGTIPAALTSAPASATWSGLDASARVLGVYLGGLLYGALLTPAASPPAGG